MSLKPGQKLSHYRLIEKIGEGGMGVVWKARDEKLRRDVALKVLPAELVEDPERRRRLLREARSVAAINHPNIGTVHEVDEAEGTVFIAMELVEGKTLRSLLGGEPVAIPEALRLAMEMAEGLVAAHQANVIHRDLKPENVLIRADGHVKILDFGLAKLVVEAPRGDPSQQTTLSADLTREGTILGTGAYMAPEQIRGETADFRSDLFAFGIVVYEMVTGRRPFLRESVRESLPEAPPTVASHLNPSVSSELDRILGKCLEKDPDDRYQDGRDLVVDVRRLRRHLDSTDRGREPLPPEPELSRSSSAVDEGRFLPGTVMAGRYRMVALLGKGGMGEVYRAFDLKLGQAVALKFLPQAVATDPRRLSRLHREVRIVRQIAHPNVCRVYDIGEVEGQHFVSMEYVDGEDLAALLRRIGRLPQDKAIQMAHQLCTGVAAAHERGFLHRDLKPANVMIDSQGRVRILDFGLADVAGETPGSEIKAGTPAYMAPEQHAGQEVSVRSDIYALGLVLYEMFTGKPAFEAGTFDEIARVHQEVRPADLSAHVPNVDPAVEKVVLRCLEKDPSDRPELALTVAAALPGGDPLAAALAAGETPSPEVVAAGGEVGGLRPGVAVACLAAILVGFLIIVLLYEKVALFGVVPLDKPPESLAETARDIFRTLGYTERAGGSAYGFDYDLGFIDYVETHDASPTRWDRLADGGPSPIYFWYRQSPGPLFPTGLYDMVSLGDPPPEVPGMASALLDPEGRLISLDAVNPEAEGNGAPSPDPDWSALFVTAGLDLANFTAAVVTRVPPAHSDSRAAWEGTYPGSTRIPIRVEAAAYRGRPVYFRILWPWGPTGQPSPSLQAPATGAGETYLTIFFMVLLPAAALLTRRNLRRGRGDRRGAFRVAAYVFSLRMLWWLFGASHVALVAKEWERVVNALGQALFLSGMIWLLYLGLEPYVRRRWPDSIIAWSRLLAGRFRDPLVGRDCLVGASVGTALIAWLLVGYVTLKWLGLPTPAPPPAPLGTLNGSGGLIAGFFQIQLVAVFGSMYLLLLLLLLHGIFRKWWLTSAVCVLVFAPLSVLGTGGQLTIPLLLLAVVNMALVIFTVTRFGLLALIVAEFFFYLLFTFPITSDAAAWHVESTFSALLIAAAISVYGFYTSLADRPILPATFLED